MQGLAPGCEPFPKGGIDGLEVAQQGLGGALLDEQLGVGVPFFREPRHLERVDANGCGRQAQHQAI